MAKVFPETQHHLCFWHKRKKFPEKLAQIYHKKSIFEGGLKKKCFRDSRVQSFEEERNRLIIEYILEENVWLQGLYKIRESWIPIYNRSTLIILKRTESINAFFFYILLWMQQQHCNNLW